MSGYNKPYVKSVAFYHHKGEDMELHEMLKHLPHGDFQTKTKEFWRAYLAENPDILELPQNFKR